MRNNGVLFYKLGSYGLILFTLVHSLSFFSDPAELLTNAEDARVWQLIQTHVFQIGGLSFTTKKLFTGFNLYLTIFTLFAGVLNILVFRNHFSNTAFLKLMATANLVMIGLVWIVTFIFFHLPPLLLFGLSWLLFLFSFIFLGKSSAS